MQGIDNFLYGMGVAIQPANLFYCFIGVVFGTLTGVIPGFGSVAAIALLMPLTYSLPATSAIIMLAGIYYGAQYGGSTTSILLNIPGESSSVVTCLDGYQMAKQGRAGPAIGIAAFGSFIAGICAAIGLLLVAPPLADIALRFGPPEYVALILVGLSMVALLSTKSTLKGLIMGALGLFLGTVGMEPTGGQLRFTCGLLVLSDGIGLIPMVMGLFGVCEVLLNIEEGISIRGLVQNDIKDLLPSLKDWMQTKWSILRGTLIGFFLGLLPGGGAMLASFVAYTTEKSLSKTPERFGMGAIEGVAAPESANNAAAQSAFVPLLTLGLPSNPVTAIMLAAIIIHGLTPGPLLVSQNPELFWGVITSMVVGNAMLLIINLPLIPIWVKILRIPYIYLFPAILLFCIVGVYAAANKISDAGVMLIFGIIGYFLNKLDYEPAPLILGMVLGPMFENSFIQSLRISYGSPWVFLNRPISLGLLIGGGLFFLIPFLLRFKEIGGGAKDQV